MLRLFIPSIIEDQIKRSDTDRILIIVEIHSLRYIYHGCGRGGGDIISITVAVIATAHTIRHHGMDNWTRYISNSLVSEL